MGGSGDKIGWVCFVAAPGRGDRCCSEPKSCLPHARPVLGASVSEWHIRPWDGCHRAQRQGGMDLCHAPGGMVVRGSGCAQRFSPKLGNPGITSMWDWRVVASNTYPPNRLLSYHKNRLEQMYTSSLWNNALQESGNSRNMGGMWRVGGEINTWVQQLNWIASEDRLRPPA